MLSAASITKQDSLYVIVKAVMSLLASIGVSRPTVQVKNAAVMYIARILSKVYRKLSSQVSLT